MFLDDIKNTVVYVNDFIQSCPKCKNRNLQSCRASMRGTGEEDKTGLYCCDCRILYLLK